MTNIHLHIENDGLGPPSLQLSRERLSQALEPMRATGVDVLVTENGRPEAMEASIEGADILFACGKINIASAKAASPTLRWVQVISAGVEAYLEHLPPGVVLTNASGVHSEKGAEFVLAAALMLNYRIPAFVTHQQQAEWVPTFGGTLRGKRITLLGVGGIGAAAASLLRVCGARVTGVTRSSASPVPLDECIGVGDLDDILPETDILVSTLPATAETRGLVDARRLALLPPAAGIVIVGRAAVFDYAAMQSALRTGALDGAVLDVFPDEPLPASDLLWGCPRVIMTPHCSVDDHAGYLDRCIEIFAANLRAFVEGRPLVNVVDPDRGY